MTMPTPVPGPPPQPPPEQHDRMKTWHLVVAVAALVVAITGVFLDHFGVIIIPGSSGTNPIAITSPTEGAAVTGSFSVSGTAPDLGDNSLWLFVLGGNSITPGDVYYRTTNTSLDIVNGNWKVDIGPLGESGDAVGSPYTLVLVRADPSCSTAIANLSPSSTGERFFQTLPNGCSEAVPPLHVTKAP